MQRDVPKVADLYVQLRHARVDLLPGRRLAVEGERGALRVRMERPLDNHIRLSLRAFELDLYMALVAVVLDERLEVLCTAKHLLSMSAESPNRSTWEP